VAQSVLIVDDHPSFRATARLLLELEGYDVVGEAPDGESAITAAHELRPEVVLFVAKRLTNCGGGPAVVLCSSRDYTDFGPLVASSGARGFIAKADLSGEALAEVLAR
jgi:DNA-binding NarL/FixJ family response regulator